MFEVEKFQCLNEKCGHQWEGVGGFQPQCPKCFKTYIKWLTYNPNRHWNTLSKELSDLKKENKR